MKKFPHAQSPSTASTAIGTTNLRIRFARARRILRAAARRSRAWFSTALSIGVCAGLDGSNFFLCLRRRKVFDGRQCRTVEAPAPRHQQVAVPDSVTVSPARGPEIFF